MAESKKEMKSFLIKKWKSWHNTQHSNNKDHGIWPHHFMANNWGNNGNNDRFYFLGLQNYFRWWLQPWNERHLLLGRKSITKLDSKLKVRDITLPTKVCVVNAMIFPVAMQRCESWIIKKAEQWRIDALELQCCIWLDCPLDCKIKPSNPKGNQTWLLPWIFIGGTDAEAEVPILWPPHMKSWLTGKESLILGKKVWRRRRGW